MVTLRVAQVSVTGARKLRVAQVTMTGSASTPKLRVASVVMRGNVALSLQPINTLLVEALQPVVLQAVKGATSATPDSYTWRQLPDPGVPMVTFSDNGTNISFISPAHWLGLQIRFGVTAHLAGQDSAEQVGVVNVINHLYWKFGSDGILVPRTVPVKV